MIKTITQNALFKNSAIFFAGSMLANILNYAFHLVVGRMVSIEVYGEIESLVSLINIISIPALTITMIATRYCAEYKANRDKSGTYQIIRYLNRKVFTYGVPVFLLAICLTPLASNFLKIENKLALLIVWLMMFGSFFAAINTGALNGWQKFKNTSIIGILGVAVKLIFGIVFIKIGLELSGVMGSFALGMIASYIASWLFLKFIFGRKKHNNEESKAIDLGAIKKYAISLFLGNLAINILGNVDMVIAKSNLDSFDAGWYGGLTIASKTIFFATGVIATVLFSMSAEDKYKNKKSNNLRNALILVGLGSAVGTIIFFIAPGFILSILFGDKYIGAASYLGWFALMVSIFSVNNLIFQYLLSLQKTRFIYSLLAVAIIGGGAILLFGKSIADILMLMIGAQIISVIIGIVYLRLYKNDDKK